MSDFDTLRRIGGNERGLANIQTHEHPRYGARVNRTANLSLTNNTLTAVPFDNERWDDAAFHSTAANTERLTAPFAGDFLIGGSLQYAPSAVGQRFIAIGLNSGTVWIAADFLSASSGDVTRMAISTYWRANAGDFFALVAFQNSGGALNLEVVNGHSVEFWIKQA